MGVEHFMVCRECKKYIDLHKAYWFERTIHNYRPPLYELSNDAAFDRYWNGRAIWFLWHHKDHGEKIEMHSDANDEWNAIKYELEEVFESREDFKKESK